LSGRSDPAIVYLQSHLPGSQDPDVHSNFNSFFLQAGTVAGIDGRAAWQKVLHQPAFRGKQRYHYVLL
jgi:hypothetical protein